MRKLFAMGGLSLLLAWGAPGQVTPPSFEVVSAKLADEAPGISITPRRSGNRISYVTLVGMLIDYAYHVQPFQVWPVTLLCVTLPAVPIT